MKIENTDTKDKLIKRLRRIEGQVRGIQEMLDRERDCRDIMQQLSAVNSAVRSTSRSFFQDYAVLCLAEMGADISPDQGEEDQQLLKEMIALLDKTP